MISDLFPIGLTGGMMFWICFIILGLLMPFFIFINTFTLGKIFRELQKINKYFELVEKRRVQETLGHKPREVF